MVHPEGVERTQPGVSTLIFVHKFGETQDSWKASLDGANNYRLEAYTTLISGVSSDLSRTSWRNLREPTATTRRRKVA